MDHIAYIVLSISENDNIRFGVQSPLIPKTD